MLQSPLFLEWPWPEARGFLEKYVRNSQLQQVQEQALWSRTKTKPKNQNLQHNSTSRVKPEPFLWVGVEWGSYAARMPQLVVVT